MMLTIAIKQYSNQKSALRYCKKLEKDVQFRFDNLVNLVVNQVASDVFQVELVGSFPEKEINLIF